MNTKYMKELHDKIVKEKALNHRIPEKYLKEYAILIKTLDNFSCVRDSEQTKIRNTSGLFSLFISNFALSIDNKGNNIKLKLCIRSLAITISNNILAILHLSFESFNYQSNVLLRNTYELCFIFLVIIIDREKCEAYYDSAKNQNDYETWRKHFSFNQLNKTLMEFENSLSGGNSLVVDYISSWRKEQYKKYSGYIHNNFLNCIGNCYVNLSKNDDEFKLNIWGKLGSNNMLNDALESINMLLLWCGLLLRKIISINKIENDICKKDTEFWNNSWVLFYMAQNLMNEYIDDSEES